MVCWNQQLGDIARCKNRSTQRSVSRRRAAGQAVAVVPRRIDLRHPIGEPFAGRWICHGNVNLRRKPCVGEAALQRTLCHRASRRQARTNLACASPLLVAMAVISHLRGGGIRYCVDGRSGTLRSAWSGCCRLRNLVVAFEDEQPPFTDGAKNDDVEDYTEHPEPGHRFDGWYQRPVPHRRAPTRLGFHHERSSGGVGGHPPCGIGWSWTAMGLAAELPSTARPRAAVCSTGGRSAGPTDGNANACAGRVRAHRTGGSPAALQLKWLISRGRAARWAPRPTGPCDWCGPIRRDHAGSASGPWRVQGVG